MKREGRICFVLCLTAMLGFAGTNDVSRTDTNDLSVARAALKDGLWSLARQHAASHASPDAVAVVLESYAREGRWEDVRRTLKDVTAVASPVLDYYRALVDHDIKRAVRLLEEKGSAEGRLEARMLMADLCRTEGDMDRARQLWREVVVSTNAGERAFVFASAALGEARYLRTAYARAEDPELRRLAGYRLAWALLDAAETRAEGEKLVRQLVRDAPDAPDAVPTFLRLADLARADERWSEALRVYQDAVEIWPALTKEAPMMVAYGETRLKNGLKDGALDLFRAAETAATNDETRAHAILWQGDALTDLGRGDAALERYRHILEKYPATAVGQRLKKLVKLREQELHATDLYRSYRFQEARTAFAEVAADEPSRASRMKYLMALCDYGLGHDKDACVAMRTLVETCVVPSLRYEARLWLAKFAFNATDWKAAASAFRACADDAVSPQGAASALLWSARAFRADGDNERAIATATELVSRHPDAPEAAAAALVQAEALVDLARFDEAVLVLERLLSDPRTSSEVRGKAEWIRADAYFAMGADNALRYETALKSYQGLALAGDLSADQQLSVAFKIGRTLEKLGRLDEAIDQYYARVVIAYGEGCARGERYDEATRASYVRAALRLADLFEGQGRDVSAVSVLRRLVDSGVPAAEEARRRIERISMKGRFL